MIPNPATSALESLRDACTLVKRNGEFCVAGQEYVNLKTLNAEIEHQAKKLAAPPCVGPTVEQVRKAIYDWTQDDSDLPQSLKLGKLFSAVAALYAPSVSAGAPARRETPQVELEMPQGDERKPTIWWSEWRGDVLHVCISVDGSPAPGEQGGDDPGCAPFCGRCKYLAAECECKDGPSNIRIAPLPRRRVETPADGREVERLMQENRELRDADAHTIRRFLEVRDECDDLAARLSAAEAELQQYKGLHHHAIKCVDRVFQQCTENPQPLLPDFLGIGDDKFEGVVKLAEAYDSALSANATLRERWVELRRTIDAANPQSSIGPLHACGMKDGFRIAREMLDALAPSPPAKID